jgi:hypothetical protein
MRLCAVLLILTALRTSAFGGGNRCPPRVGVIANQNNAIVFIDATDQRAFALNTTDEARFHVGHRVRIVAHVIPGSTDTLFVHSFVCLRARESVKPGDS